MPIFFGAGLAPVLLEEAAVLAHQLVDGLHHVHRYADGAGLVGYGPGDGLTYPPSGIGAELVTLAVIELLHGADEADVAFLNQVQQGHATPDVLLGHAHD